MDNRKSNISSYKTISWADGYRKSDEGVDKNPIWQSYANHLQDICYSYNTKINVLDIGCGTGRFFSALRNVDNLYGVDNSKAMLKHCNNPYMKEIVDKNINNTILIEQSLNNINIDNKFHLIYSVGLLHEYDSETTTTVEFYDKMFKLLNDNGTILFSYWETSEDDINELICKSKLNSYKREWFNIDKNIVLKIKKRNKQ